jgi:hypothetical protein
MAVQATTQPISVSRNGPLVDIIIGLKSVRHDGRGNNLFVAMGTHDGHEVGISVVLRGGMRPGFVNDRFDKTAIYPGGLVFISDGEPSDRLVAVLSGLFGIPAASAKMIDQLPVTCVATDRDPQSWQENAVRFKVFLGDESEGTYAEWFFHLNRPEGWLAFAEKSTSYRPNLIRALMLGCEVD